MYVLIDENDMHVWDYPSVRYFNDCIKIIFMLHYVRLSQWYDIGTSAQYNL